MIFRPIPCLWILFLSLCIFQNIGWTVGQEIIAIRNRIDLGKLKVTSSGGGLGIHAKVCILADHKELAIVDFKFSGTGYFFFATTTKFWDDSGKLTGKFQGQQLAGSDKKCGAAKRHRKGDEEVFIMPDKQGWDQYEWAILSNKRVVAAYVQTGKKRALCNLNKSPQKCPCTGRCPTTTDKECELKRAAFLRGGEGRGGGERLRVGISIFLCVSAMFFHKFSKLIAFNY